MKVLLKKSNLQNENESLAAKLGNIEAGNLLIRVNDINGVNVLAAKVNVADMNNFRTMVDDLKQKLESAVDRISVCTRMKR